MLLIVFGAGASYDSVPPEALPSDPNYDYRPPLANELLDNRRSFGAVLDRFPQCLPLVNPLRRKAEVAGFALEQELEALLAESPEYPLRQRQFAAFRFYLQQSLWECGEVWGRQAHWSTNYVELLARVDQWRQRRRERVLIVTFNYDTLLENAVSSALGIRLDHPALYIANDEWRFFKLHGSVDWGHPVRGAAALDDDEARTSMIEGFDKLRISNEVVRASPAESPRQLSKLVFPAIAIPVVSKSESSFECPSDHLAALKDGVMDVSKLLVIGWRGMEQHFLDLLTPAMSQIRHVFVVTGDDIEADRLAGRLGAAGAGRSSRGGGFSQFLREEGVLEGWLG